ncbi:unnamed protein product [Leptosia nina]|uniref:Uncharacterized protein n=1 Tax=Leptosia nina TaxID=320188 RepID=A0AAV1JAG9_9NEOP
MADIRIRVTFDRGHLLTSGIQVLARAARTVQARIHVLCHRTAAAARAVAGASNDYVRESIQNGSLLIYKNL